ncbi:MAG: gliding motility-associated C-terminal domain-containing protein [Chitinophagaceae bacterium]|nr:gliding motility-associated C-terminal domain-containing protein [Chitinophagaceae bacterium]
MPSAFSPNGDGVNDVFRIPPGITLQLKEFSIFNRWGGRVFSSRDINKGWDGKIDGRPAQTGTYAFIITGTDIKGSVMVTGTVVLVR